MQGLDLDVVADLTGQAPDDFMAALGGRDAAPWLLGLAMLLLLVEIQVGSGVSGSSVQQSAAGS
jgi:hypothetical protein